MAEIDDIAVSTLKSITLTTLLKIVERHAPIKAEAEAQTRPGARRPAGPPRRIPDGGQAPPGNAKGALSARGWL